MRVMGTMFRFRGIHVVVHHLLTLTADQAAAFEEGNNAYGSIQDHNFDAQASKSKTVRRKIIHRMLATKRNTLADGKFGESRMDGTSCGNACHVCTRTYLDMFWPISR